MIGNNIVQFFFKFHYFAGSNFDIRSLTLSAAQGLDFPAILGFSLMIGIVIISVNLLIDILYVILDPTISFEGKNG